MTLLRTLVPKSSGVAVLTLAGCMSAAPRHPTAGGRNSPPTTALVFDQVTVIDVIEGTLLPSRRVVITGNRIAAVGSADQVEAPAGAQIVDARGKYLIPGLWDLHIHTPKPWWLASEPLWIALGVTGVRHAGSVVGGKAEVDNAEVPFDTLLRRRREILAGTRVGPPRQILSGPILMQYATILKPILNKKNSPHEVRRLVDSLRASGIDMLKMYTMPPATYFAIAAEARRAGIAFGGHTDPVTPQNASDSGAIILDHVNWLQELCLGETPDVAGCQAAAERFRRNGTWWVPTLVIVQDTRRLGENFMRGFHWADSPRVQRLYAAKEQVIEAFLRDSLPRGNWLRKAMPIASDSTGFMRVAHRVGMPLLTGTDIASRAMGPFSLHTELAMLVAEGLTPLAALQAATLNPAKAFRATDSLGTVAPGKLADLVLLDANPLADITNTTMIRAVVANGRYFDRAALDRLLTEVRSHPELRRQLRRYHPAAIPISGVE